VSKMSTTFDERFCGGYTVKFIVQRLEQFTCGWEGGVRLYMQLQEVLQDIFDRKSNVQFEKIVIMNSDTLKHISKERYIVFLVKPVCGD